MAKSVNPLEELFGTVAAEEEIELTPEQIKQKEDAEEAKRLEQEQQQQGKKKEPPAERTSEVKKQRDEARAKLAELEQKYKELEELAPLKKVSEYLKKKTKAEKLQEKDIDDFIETNKKRKAELETTNKTLKEKDERLKEISIDLSDEWQKDYKQPLVKARNGLFATIAVLDDASGEVKNPELFDGLVTRLLEANEKTGEPLELIQVKGVLGKFAKMYEEKTGQPYDIPSPLTVKNAIDSVASLAIKSFKARKDWEKTLEEKNKTKEYEEFEENEKRTKLELSAREKITNSIIFELDEDQFGGAFTKDEVEKSYKDTFEFMNGVALGKVKPKVAKDGMITFAKGQMFDSLLEKYKELVKSKEVNKGLPRGSTAEQSREVKKVASKEENPKGWLD